jgi:membrane-associated phospholipid phosphatase
MKTYRHKFIILVFFCLCLVEQVYAQSPASDSLFHPYRVNYWVSGSICGVGVVTNYLGIPRVLGKENVSLSELQVLNKGVINSIDSWALKQDPSKVDAFENYSDYTLAVSLALPGFLMFDKHIRRDWSDALLMYMETMTITTNIFEWSFLGPSFQNKFRPITYYDQLTYDQRNSGSYRNSFYSGHVATLAASTFFMAKVYSDYNPGIGNNKYLMYGAATIPPLILGYCRVRALKHFPSDVMAGVTIGALVGIIVPELHRLQDKNISLGLYSSSEAAGIAITWQSNFLQW